MSWHRGVVVITTAQLPSAKPELKFCSGSNPALGMSEIRDGEDLWQWSQLEIRINTFRWSTIPQKQFIIIIIIIIIIVNYRSIPVNPWTHLLLIFTFKSTSNLRYISLDISSVWGLAHWKSWIVLHTYIFSTIYFSENISN